MVHPSISRVNSELPSLESDLQNSAKSGERHRSVEELRRLSLIAFGGSQAKAGLSPRWAS